ncbi:MAG TPA: bifunctional 4-hydroxy-2-oxoglutarate aldolase/2-dehydro-3-deoxy-phosphogluconate aldolase [bacterium]|nr:bifunctional 4-hydroxy-2-oxoglutarate aldolase/2-dehydro-3-deoxy-phosphogluconate aldolase [bacterium]
MNFDAFLKKPVLGIMRGVPLRSVAPVVECAAAAGLETVEIAMNSPDAQESIREAVKAAGGRMAVGAGTVISHEILESAVEAGATFVVMPTFVDHVVRLCIDRGMPVFPGALTPLEIHRAWESGATMVKVFPSGVFGPAYFKEIKGPFADVRLLACGGVTPENAADYFRNGAAAVAFGGSVFRKEWIDARAFDRVGEAVKAFVDASAAAIKKTTQ